MVWRGQVGNSLQEDRRGGFILPGEIGEAIKVSFLSK